MGLRDSEADYSALLADLYPWRLAVAVVLDLARYGSEDYFLRQLVPSLVLLLSDPDVYQQSLLRGWKDPRRSQPLAERLTACAAHSGLACLAQEFPTSGFEKIQVVAVYSAEAAERLHFEHPEAPGFHWTALALRVYRYRD